MTTLKVVINCSGYSDRRVGILHSFYSQNYSLQSFAKYIWSLLSFAGGLDLEQGFSIAFWLFSAGWLWGRICGGELGTGLCFGLFISLQPNYLFSFRQMLKQLQCSFSLYILLMLRLWLQLFLNLRNFANIFCKLLYCSVFLPK